MALSLYRIVWNWHRAASAEHLAASYGEDVMLGV